MNYQYRYATSAREAASRLWHDGGVLRFYRGVTFALLQVTMTTLTLVPFLLVGWEGTIVSLHSDNLVTHTLPAFETFLEPPLSISSHST